MVGTRGKKKQSRLTFAPIEEPSPRPPSSFTPSRLRYSNPFSGEATIKGQLQLDDYTRGWKNGGRSRSDNPTLNGAGQRPSPSEAIPNQESTKQSNRFHSRLSASPRLASNTATHDDEDSNQSSDLEIIRPSKRRRIQTVILSDGESDQKSRPSLTGSKGESSKSRVVNDESKMKSTPRRRSGRLKAGFSPALDSSPRSVSLKMDLSGLGEPEESASQQLASSPTYRKRRGRAPSKPKAPSIIDDDTEDSDVVILSAQRKKVKADMAEPRTAEATYPVTDDDGDTSDDDVVAFTPSRRNSRRSPRASSPDDDDDEDKEELPKTPRRLRSGQDELDLEEDLEDLRDTDLRDKRTRGAIVNSARSARQKNLEILRRRRAGEKVTTDPTEEADEEEYDYEKESHKNAVNAILDWVGMSKNRRNGDEDDEANSVEANSDLDTDDSSFVEKDGELGAPINVPFEFSRHRTKTIKECFRDVVEWMVHSKLNPAFPRNDDMYQFAFRKVDDELVGRVGSQLVSTVWNADFRNTLLARPYLDVTAYPVSEWQSCQACNRSKHPVSSELKFSGKPYSEETLEPLSDSDSDSDSDSESDSDSDSDEKDNEETGQRPDRDREGHILPPEERSYYLGKFCKSNAVLTHTLTHWRFHLYEWVIDYLNREEELLSNPERSLEREKLSAKKRTRYANKVVDKMDTSGEVQRLWRDFHQTMGSVRDMQKDSDGDAARF